MNMTSNYTKM